MGLGEFGLVSEQGVGVVLWLSCLVVGGRSCWNGDGQGDRGGRPRDRCRTGGRRKGRVRNRRKGRVRVIGRKG